MACEFVKADGSACQMPSLEGQRLCFVHSPEMAAPRARARQLGGRRNRTPYMTQPPDAPPRLRTVEDVQRETERLFGDALLMPNGAARARVLTGVLVLALRTLETAEFAARLEAVEARLALRAA